MSNSKVISFIVSLSFFMEMLDSTVINTAIPAMARSFNVAPVDLKVALISYLLSLAVFIPISGWLADKLGAKKIFITALTIFTFSSLACGFSNDLTQLVIARFIQGLGGALGLPVGRLILIRAFGRENLITTMNNVVRIGAVGMMLGPVIGGYLTHYFSWQWIFWVNIPVGLFAIILALYYLPNTQPIKVPPLDKIGFILFGVGMAGFTFGLSTLSETTVSTLTALSILFTSIVFIVIYGFHSHGKAHPIIKTDLLRFRTFRVSTMGNLISRLGFGGMPFLVPLFLQIDFGLPAQLSGLLVAPIALGIIFGKYFTLGLLRSLGYRAFLISNTLTAGFILWFFIGLRAETPHYLIALATFIYGIVLTLQFGAMNSLAYADLSSGEISSANSIMSTLQQLAQSFGVAVSAILLHVLGFFYSQESILNTKVFHATFFILGLITMLSSLIFIQLKKEDGQQMIFKRSS